MLVSLAVNLIFTNFVDCDNINMQNFKGCYNEILSDNRFTLLSGKGA